MKQQLQFVKSTLLTAAFIAGTSLVSIAATYTATTSGNWSSATTWGGSAPGFNITGADNVVIPIGVTVTQDADLTFNNAASTLAVDGSLTGTTNMILTSGTLSGAGMVTLTNMTVGASGLISSLGTINVTQLANSQTTLAIRGIMNVSNRIMLNAGSIGLTTGGAINLANNVTINMAGGAFSTIGGLPTLAGSYNLLYTGNVTTIGAEAALIGLQNVTINLTSFINQINLMGNLTVTGVLSLQQGALNLSGHTLTIIGGITTTAGSLSGSTTSNLIINGTGSVGTIAFTSGSAKLNNLTLAIGATGSASLASDLTVSGVLTLTGSSLNLNGHALTLSGTVLATTTGAITGSSTSSLLLNGTGAVGTLVFSPSGNTLGNLTIDIAASGSVLLNSSLTVSNTLTLSRGSLNLNGQNLTIGGMVNSTGTGSVSGSLLSDITFNGSGNAGVLALTVGSQTIHSLTINIGSAGTIAVSTPLTIAGTLTLAQGTVNIGAHDLTILATGTFTGGSAASYIVTSDTGSLIMTVANAGANGMFHVGTVTNYAPVTVTNNSVLAGTFNVMAHTGVLLHGTAGADVAQFQPVVNTSWNVGSSITTGANVNLLMGWSSAMQVNGFDPAQAYLSHYTAGSWNTNAISSATLSGGSYSLALTGVTSFSPFAVFGKNIALGVASISASDMLYVYPNPATDRLTIQTGSTDKITVEISDLNGQIVSKYELAGSNNTIEVANLSTGSYLVRVLNNGNSSVKKFIKI